MVRCSALKTGLGRRSRWIASPNTFAPNASLKCCSLKSIRLSLKSVVAMRWMIAARPVGLDMFGLTLVMESDGCGSLWFNYEESGKRLRSDGDAAAFAGADADRVLERQDEDLAVADAAGLPGPGRMDDRLDGRLDKRVVDGDLELQLRQQADLDLLPAIDLGVPLLPAAPADVRDGHQVDVHGVQGLL